MTREEMLEKMGFTPDGDDLKELLKKLKVFLHSLNKGQRAVLDQSLPKFAAAAKTFGPDVTEEELKKLLDAEAPVGIASGAVVARSAPN